MTKITLLAAASAAAITFAGAAQAGTVTGTINGQAATAALPYTIAAERTNAADQTAVGGFVVTNTLTTAPSLAIGGPTQSYSVTFDITGGTIPTANAATLAVTLGGTGTGSTTSITQGARSTTSIQFIVTITAPTAVAANTVDAFVLTTRASNSSAEASIAVAATVAVLAGGVSSNIDTTAATTLVRYADAVSAAVTTPRNALAALSDFKLFGVAPTNSIAAPTNGGRTAVISENYTVGQASVAANAGNLFFPGLTGTGSATLAADIVNGATVTVSGPALAATTITPSFISSGIVSPTPVRTGTTATFTLDNTAADLFANGTVDLQLEQTATTANQVAIASGDISTSVAAIYNTGYTAPSAFSLASGNIALDGVNFIAAWVGGSQSTAPSTIRLSNGATTATGEITLRLAQARARGVGVTTGSGDAIAAQTCSTAFTVPAGGELQIGSTELFNCFGNFLRGDVQITVRSASTALTAKMRNTQGGVATEATLGRFSGSAAAGSAF